MHRCRFNRAGSTWIISAALAGCAVSWALPSRAAESQVTASEALVRTAPFDVAPVLARVHAGDKLPAADHAQEGWRRVQLPDGRFGFLRDTQVTEIAPATLTPAAPLEPPPPPAPPGLPAPAASANAPTPRLPVTAPSEGAEPHAGPTLLGITFELLPAGKLKVAIPTATQTETASADTVFAFAIAPFIDVPLSPFFTVGASPQVIFHVKGDAAPGESATELDLRARFTARKPVSPDARVYGRFSPAYSSIFLPAPGTSSNTSTSNATGLVVDLAVGTEVQLVPNLFLVVDLGYQLGFQSASRTDAAMTATDVDLRTRYLHLGAGLALGL